VIGKKDRQIWIGEYSLQILGPEDDVFGENSDCNNFL